MSVHSFWAGVSLAVVTATLSGACGGGDRHQPRVGRCQMATAAPTALADLPAPAPVWSQSIPDISLFSPRDADLDGDGHLEILISGGREEPRSGAMLAVDAATGRLLWQKGSTQQLYNSPVFLDVNGDGVKDVFIGGRNKELLSIDGATGALLWQFPTAGPDAPDGWYNFYTAVVIGDQTGDGVPDLLLANGGDDAINERGAPRPPGRLLVVDAVTGAPKAWADNPDHEETYMSPLVIPVDGAPSPTVLFGSGGESRGGGLWKTTLAAVLAQDTSQAKRLVRTEDKGVIAPPALADLNGDGRRDAVVATFTGHLVALDGATDQPLWERIVGGAESYSTPALGYFDDDDVPDVFAVFLRGVFPDYASATRMLVSGRDGSVLWQEDAGTFSMSGDIAVDLDGDGVDEVIFSANDTSAPDDAQHQLYLLDARARQARPWGSPLGATAVGSPWVGDADGDGCLDLVVSRASKSGDRTSAVVTRYRVAAEAPSQISWAGYLGTKFDSTLHRLRRDPSP